MNLTLIIVCVILIGSVFVPYYFFILAGKSETNTIKSKFKASIEKNNLKVSQSETWANNYIAIDTDQKKLFFLKIHETESKEQLIDMNKIKETKIVIIKKSIKTKYGLRDVLDKLDLEIFLINGERIFLNFYDSNQIYTEDFELKRAENWKSIIFELTKTLNLGKKAA
jgi:hypothetical protein